MLLTHNTLMTLPLNKMIADTNGLYFKRTGPQKGTWTFRYMRHGRARTMSLGPYPVLSLAEAFSFSKKPDHLVVYIFGYLYWEIWVF